MATAAALRPLVVALALAVALTGCAGQESAGVAATGSAAPTPTPSRVPPGWQEPASYSYTLESRCGEQQLIGKFRVTVAGGAVTGAEGLDEQGLAALRGTKPDFIPTLRQLIDQVDKARSSGAAVAEVESDPAGGHPVRITIDMSKNSIDDESCFTITDYRPA
jgi:hypothetical protein